MLAQPPIATPGGDAAGGLVRFKVGGPGPQDPNRGLGRKVRYHQLAAFGRNQTADRQTGNMGRGGIGESQWRETDVAYFWPEPAW